jgi:adenylate cyclase
VLADAARETGLEPELIRRIWTAAGFSAESLEHLGEDDLQLLQRLGAVLDAGLPLVAFLQLVRVYGQALAQIADAEVKLFHLYVHEPMIGDGAPVLDIAEELSDLASELLPLAGPIMDFVHQRTLQHFLAQDVVGHLELVADDAALGRVRVAIAFADLAGYTRLTEEVGEEEALEVVERFVEVVGETLPDTARVIKTIGDEVMVVGTDAAALADWAVGLVALSTERPLPRIGVHVGSALYRDGDYYGRAVNLAARVGARATGGEVLVTREVCDAAGKNLLFQPIGEVKLKGFGEATELFLAGVR